MTRLLWLRRDLRRDDLPALNVAADGDAEVAAVFVIDPVMWAAVGPVRRAWLAASIDAARESYDDRLTVRIGDPRQVLPELASSIGARSVHVSRETTPAGRRRDSAVAAELASRGVDWVETGTPYVLGPGVVTTKAGEGFKVFTPFARAWREHGAPAPAPHVDPRWVELDDDPDALAAIADALAAPDLPDLPPAGEDAARRVWARFLDDGVQEYATRRDFCAEPGTSQLSPYLKVGAIHPRTLFADLNGHPGAGVETFGTELIWREFYADVLWRHPRSAWHDLTTALAGIEYDDDPEAHVAWQEGRTGYPFIDAAMRQLRATGWMHNRARMATASFYTKDLHLWWPDGARHFLDHLVDGDIASNNHGWQWVAGTGTDASPYFRVFNPVTQGLKFDPDGSYVRRWVPELAHLPGKSAHEPWKHADGYAHGYPEPIVDHADERRVALARYEAARKS